MSALRVVWFPFGRVRRDPLISLEWSFPNEGKMHRTELADKGEVLIEIPEGDDANGFAIRVFPFWVSDQIKACERDIQRATAEIERLRKIQEALR